MAEIRNLTRNGETFYPLTCTDAVVDRDGNPLEIVNDIFDISEYNASGTPPTLAKYSTLALALAAVPQSKQKGGMTIRYVQSSDNKYVQFRYMDTDVTGNPNPFLDTANWQGIDDEPTAGSRNLVESGGIYNALEPYSEITKIENGDIDDSESIKVVNNDNTETILEISNDGVNAKNLKSNGDDVLTGQDVNDIYTKEDIYVAVQEQSWVSDDYDANGNGEEFAKINGQGIYAKNFHKLDGSPVGYETLNGKKWAVLGDSFSKGDNIGTLTDGKYAGENKSYPYLIGNRTGINVLKFFENGRTLAFPAEPGTFTNSVTNPTQTFYYQNIPADVDYITIYLGINDSHHAQGSSGGDGEDNTGVIPIGTISDSTTATYYGAWNVVLTWLLENRPFSHIGIIVSNGCETVDYRTAQIAIARKYGIPFIDLNGDDRTPFMLRSKNPDIPNNIKNIRIQQQAIDPSSNTHPNANAHLFESYFIENFLRTI